MHTYVIHVLLYCNFCFCISGIEHQNSIDWILQHSKTAKMYKDTTILCCIYGSVLSSSDLHHHYLLEQRFPNIQAISIEISGQTYRKFGIYRLTEFGTRQLGSCFKKSFKEHSACAKSEFYAKVNSADYMFCDFESLQNSVGSNNHCHENVLVPNLDGQTDLEEDVCFIYPGNVLDEFTKKAKNHRDDKGLPKELIAFVAGYKDGDVLIGTELIFPNQSGTTIRVDDEGKTN